MDVLQSHLPPPHVVIMVQGGQLAVDRLDQIVVDRLRHVVRKHGRLEGRRVVPRLGIVNVLLHRRTERGRQRVLVGLVLGIVGLERARADVAVGRTEKGDEVAVAQFQLLALFVLHRAELEIAVGQLAENLDRRLRHLVLHRQQPLFLLAERVRLEADDPRKQQLVRGQRLGLQELVNLRRGNREDLRIHEARSLGRLGGYPHEAAHHPLIDAVRLVLAGFQVGVMRQAVAHAVEVQIEGNALGQRVGAVGQVALKLFVAVETLPPGDKRRFPGIVIGVEARQVPGVGRIDLAAAKQFLDGGILGLGLWGGQGRTAHQRGDRASVR